LSIWPSSWRSMAFARSTTTPFRIEPRPQNLVYLLLSLTFNHLSHLYKIHFILLSVYYSFYFSSILIFHSIQQMETELKLIRQTF
jgi:hypothetical protein